MKECLNNSLLKISPWRSFPLKIKSWSPMMIKGKMANIYKKHNISKGDIDVHYRMKFPAQKGRKK